MNFGIGKAKNKKLTEIERMNALESAEQGDFNQLDLFSKPHRQKTILEDGTIEIKLKSKNKYTIQVKGPLIKVQSKLESSKFSYTRQFSLS